MTAACTAGADPQLLQHVRTLHQAAGISTEEHLAQTRVQQSRGQQLTGGYAAQQSRGQKRNSAWKTRLRQRQGHVRWSVKSETSAPF
jgi:hypothetical protein